MVQASPFCLIDDIALYGTHMQAQHAFAAARFSGLATEVCRCLDRQVNLGEWFSGFHGGQRHQRKHRQIYGKALLSERRAIERFFNKLKQFRSVATNCEKLLTSFAGFVKSPPSLPMP